MRIKRLNNQKAYSKTNYKNYGNNTNNKNLELIYLYFPPSFYLTVSWKDGRK